MSMRIEGGVRAGDDERISNGAQDAVLIVAGIQAAISLQVTVQPPEGIYLNLRAPT